MRFYFKKFLVLLLTSFLIFSNPQIIDDLALSASVSVDRQAALPTSDRFVNNIEDELGNVWEVILFEKNQRDSKDLVLRLVGFPLLQIDRAKPLQITTSDGNSFAVADLYDRYSPAFHIAEYSLTEILPELPTNQTLDLAYYLTNNLEGEGSNLPANGGNRQVNLKISPVVVRQWQEFAKTKLKGDRNYIFDPLKITFLVA